MHNGFTLADNPDDFLTVRLGIGRNDPEAAGKTLVLEQLGISPHGHFALRRKGKGLDPLLLAFLRVLCLKGESEVKAWTPGEEAEAKEEDAWKRTRRVLLKGGDGEGELSEEDRKLLSILEERAHRYLLTRCELLLRSYPTALEQDVEDLDSKKTKEEKEGKEQLSTARRFCLQLRAGEKRILLDTIGLCKDKVGKK